MEMDPTYPTSNGGDRTVDDFPEHYLPAMPAGTLVELARRVVGALDRSE